MKTERFPITVKEKGVSAVIRRTHKECLGKKHTYFITEFFLNGKRKQVWRSNLASATAVARDACIKISNGKQASLELSDRDRFTILRATEALEACGVPLDVAAHEFAAAVKILPAGTSLREAVYFFKQRNGTALERRTVEQVADEMIRVKRTAGLSAVHLADLET